MRPHGQRTDVVFVFAPGGAAPSFEEHLGAAYLRAVLAGAGISSSQYHPGRNVGLGTFADFLREQRPAVVGFTAYESNLRACRALAGVVRETLPGTVVLVGGPNATFSPDETLTWIGADVCLRGAGEGTIVELAGALLGSAEPRRELEDLLGTVPNLALWSERRAVHTRAGDLASFPTGYFRHLDDLPSPYQLGLVESTDVGLMTARGCNQHCTYCSFAAISGRRVHHHSVERVLEDLAALARIAALGHSRSPLVTVNDDAFTLSPARARRICEGIIARRLKLPLLCETRADRVDLDLLRLMRRAGFVGISFGLESAVPHVLRAIGKVQAPDTPDDPSFERERAWIEAVRRAVQQAKRAGLAPTLSIIGGLPGESADDLRATMAFVEELGVTQYAHNVLTLLPGTPLHASRRVHGIEARREAQTGRWRTTHAYDVRSVGVLASSLTTTGRRNEAREITDALCGRPRPDRSCEASVWAVVLHDRAPEQALLTWLSRVLAIHGVVVVIGGARAAVDDDRQAWLAALESGHVSYGQLALLSRQRSSARAEVLRTIGSSGRHELTLSRSWSGLDPTLRADEQGSWRASIWLGSVAGAPPRGVDVDLVAGPSPQIADACRWWTRERRCTSPAVLHVWPDDRVTACWGGPALGRVGDEYVTVAARGLALLAATAGSACPLGRPRVGGEDVATLEVASVIGWQLGGGVTTNPRGNRSWRPRRRPRASRIR